MDEFRKGETRVLITTDVWARGLDVQQVRQCGAARRGGLYVQGQLVGSSSLQS